MVEFFNEHGEPEGGQLSDPDTDLEGNQKRRRKP